MNPHRIRQAVAAVALIQTQIDAFAKSRNWLTHPPNEDERETWALLCRVRREAVEIWVRRGGNLVEPDY